MSISQINQAVQILQRGGLVAFPTETVYGLGADSTNPAALQRIFAAKQRPIDHPLIVHFANIESLSLWAKEISPLAYRLAEAFWPGPMTLILKKADSVSPLITGNQDTIGIRIPNHPIAQELLKNMDTGLAAPSANRYGRISPTTAEAVCEELGEAVDLILDGGQCEVGVESTIIDMSDESPVILRPGMIGQKRIETVLNQTLHTKEKNRPRVSGSMKSHYAPVTRTKLIATHKILEFFANITSEDVPAVLLLRNPINLSHKKIQCIVMPNTPELYARDLYLTLRLLDKKGLRQIVIEAVPNEIEWAALRDRLERATSMSPKCG